MWSGLFHVLCLAEDGGFTPHAAKAGGFPYGIFARSG
jgi:hypothetical protein